MTCVTSSPLLYMARSVFTPPRTANDDIINIIFIITRPLRFHRNFSRTREPGSAVWLYSRAARDSYRNPFPGGSTYSVFDPSIARASCTWDKFTFIHSVNNTLRPIFAKCAFLRREASTIREGITSCEEKNNKIIMVLLFGPRNT